MSTPQAEVAWTQGNVAVAWTLAGMCTVSTRHRPCPELDAGVLTVGCVHEHLHAARPCLGCLERVRASLKEGLSWCHLCAQGELPHDCRVYELKWEPSG